MKIKKSPAGSSRASEGRVGFPVRAGRVKAAGGTERAHGAARVSGGAFVAPPIVAIAAVPEGMRADFLTGRPVADTPEEYVRQNLEKALVRQYRYAPSDCSPEFRIKMGSAKPRVDIVVFAAGQPKAQEHGRIIVETKKPGTSAQGKRDGIGQLHSYMAACPNVEYGLWTNGDERFCYAKRVVKGVVSFEEIIDLPAAGQTEAEAFRPQRKNLMPATADNLLFAFRRCHNYIAANEGSQKPEAFWELLKLIFCKIEDERSGVVQFFVTPTELASATAAAPAKARIAQLMSSKVVRKYPTIFTGADQEIQMQANTVAFVVSQLQRFSLLASSVDVKGVAYEEVVGSNLRGDRGEFFTPRNACRMAVAMLDPGYEESVLDPACGTGGFLITAMNHALERLRESERREWVDPDKPTEYERRELDRKRNDYLSRRVSGLDLNPALVRAAKMNMVMNNDGEGSLFQANSLASPHRWSKGAAERLPFGSVDVIFTNPPFGTRIVHDDEEVLAQYDLAAHWDHVEGEWTMRTDKDGRKVLQKSQPPEILFIERCIQLLKPGTGRMAIVLPNGILNNPALEYVRHWILRKTQVLAVVDMARELFQPKNDTQTSVLLLRRLSAKEELAAQDKGLDYPAFMAVAERVGHDKRLNTIYRHNPDGSEIIHIKIEKVLQIDPDTGAEVLRDVEVRERVVDDELGDVADAYRAWLAKQQ
jgi:type I restriction enzyme M protein